MTLEKGSASRYGRPLLAFLVAVLVSVSAHAQVLVQPRRAFKSPVRQFDFAWQYVDVLASPAPSGAAQAAPSAGLRLYFYERERDIAELAVPSITRSYELLSSDFHYTPSVRFPYVLYNTYQEFLETNLFAAQEGILGVTSPHDLTLTLPYFGDHRRFREVSTHEMAHQFTIQKLRDIARKADEGTSPIELMPLWFIEGLAEYYAQGGLDPETEMLARDLVVNPDVESGYALRGFFQDRPGSVMWTYKIGQARCAFLEQTYGEGTLQRILDRSLRLVAAPKKQRTWSFPVLLQQVTGDDPSTLETRFVEWLKRRAYHTFLAASQPAMSLVRLDHDFDGQIVTALSAAPDGSVIAYRATSLDSYQTELVLVDPRRPRDEKAVVSDGVPGADSLHPIAPRNFEVGARAVVYVAEVDSHDALYWQDLRRDGDGKLRLGDRRRYDLGKLASLIAVDAPSLSPDGERVAFVGTDGRGFRDVFVLEPRGPAPSVRRVTNDLWAERQLSWGQRGIVFTSDGVPNRFYNLFLLDPDAGGLPVQLTHEERDVADPLATSDGRILFTAYDDGRADVYELVGDDIVKRTSVTTGLSDVAPGADGTLWALWLESGRRRPVKLRRELMLAEDAGKVDPTIPPAPLERESLTGARRYDPYAIENWRLGQLFGLLGAGGGGIWGQVMASAADRMHDHALILNAAVYGRVDLFDGMLLYVDQGGRVGKGVGAFESIMFRNDRTFDAQRLRFTSLERFYGGLGLLRLPFNTYEYVEGELALGGVTYFLESPERKLLAGASLDGGATNLLDHWNHAYGDTRLQSELTLRYGRDTVRYHPAVGPLDGTSVLAEASFTAQPTTQDTFGDVRLDGARYFRLAGATTVGGRLGVGTSYGGRLTRQYYLSSFDTLRGVGFGDVDFLLGSHFFFSTVELRVPLTAVVKVAFLPAIVGVVGVDFGAVGDQWDTLLDKRVLDAALGLNFVFGPLVFRLHFARPIGTGADPRRAGIDRLGPASGWVTNVSLNWLYL